VFIKPSRVDWNLFDESRAYVLVQEIVEDGHLGVVPQNVAISEPITIPEVELCDGGLMTAVNMDEIKSPTRIIPHKCWDGYCGIACDEFAAARKSPLNELEAGASIGVLADVETRDVRGRICEEKEECGVTGIETDFENAGRRATEREDVHLLRQQLGGCGCTRAQLFVEIEAVPLDSLAG
jgi:hypothetical protein